MSKIEPLWKRLVVEGWAEDKDHALEMIARGEIEVSGQPCTNPRTSIKAETSVRLSRPQPWASRGAYKLLTALQHFNLSPQGEICLDVGASTGGFTDVLLHYGAKVVYALDVGYGQLISRLAMDPRVLVYDRTNARTLGEHSFEEKPAFVVSDASFISLVSLMPALHLCSSHRARFLLLIKPQFELPAELVPEGGVVRDEGLHLQACNSVTQKASDLGWRTIGIVPSHLKGTKGNQEYLACFEKVTV